MNALVKFLLPILRLILQNASPLIKDTIAAFIRDLKKKAAETPNEYDDLLVDFLAALLGVEV